jgi:hypothetical protein
MFGRDGNIRWREKKERLIPVEKKKVRGILSVNRHFARNKLETCLWERNGSEE